MAKFVKLTQLPSGDTFYVNIEFVSIIRVIGGSTVVFYEGDEHSIVSETPEQILQMIADETPPPVTAGEFPRIWRDGWPHGMFHGAMFPPQWPSNKDWDHGWTEVTSFDQVADSLHKPTQKEPLDGPPDM